MLNVPGIERWKAYGLEIDIRSRELWHASNTVKSPIPKATRRAMIFHVFLLWLFVPLDECNPLKGC